jgi:hypothetical protein
MNLPTLPTDNLYKFLALSGLAIIGFCIALPLQRINQLELKMAEIHTQKDILEIDIENIYNDMLDALATKGILNTKKQALIRKALDELFKRNDINELSKDWSKGEPVLNVKEQAIFRIKNNEIKKRLSEIKGEENKVIILMNELKTYYWIIRIGGWVGIIISFVGFTFWYILIQRPNDVLLQKQIKSP